ncbi:MAG: hypothetical protein JAZ05_13565, partial [Candidatus Thiodiazotropha taylori]|nr:hypothetical protein [Candidatus Thiodiazotropha taylori]MCW4293042.1 hypothetical protein [Candidatus Thiodiazotropha taylori]
INLMVEVVNQRISDVQRLLDKQGERERLQPLINGLHQLIETVQESGYEVVKEEAAVTVSRLLMAWESKQTI